MLLDKSAILSALKLKTESIELGSGTVIVSEIGASDYIELWTNPAYQTDGEVDMAKFTPALLAYTIVDESGKRIFTVADVAELGRSAAVPFLKLAEASKRLNGLTGTEIKNSEGTAAQSSSTASVSILESDTPTT